MLGEDQTEGFFFQTEVSFSCCFLCAAVAPWAPHLLDTLGAYTQAL